MGVVGEMVIVLFVVFKGLKISSGFFILGVMMFLMFIVLYDLNV